MNYSKTIRAYCLKNAGSIIDARQVAYDYFPMVPYKSFLKILNRLRDENILSPVSKGVYLVCCPEKEISSDDAILNDYASDSRGMIIGNMMYKELGISDYEDTCVEIYTRMIPQGSHRNIGRFKLTGVNLFFLDEIKTLIRILELIEHSSDIINRDIVKQTMFIQENLKVFSIAFFTEIVSHIRYQYSTIATLSKFNKANNKEDNFCIEIYSRVGLKQ